MARVADLSPNLPIMLDGALLEALPAAVYVCDIDGVVVRYNKRAAELWGRSPIPGDANELYCGAHRLYRPNGELMPHDQTPMVDAMRSGESFRNFEVQMEQPSGKRIWVMVSIDPLRDTSGAIVGAINCFQDITDHKLAHERKIQIDELNHRVKNVIAMVQSIALNTFQQAEPAERKAFEARMVALAKAHDGLARQNWDHVSLSEIVNTIAVPFCGGRLEFAGPDVELDSRCSVSLALALQELATNALKYGALSTSAGSVILEWDLKDGGGSRVLALRWIEATPFPVQPPTRKGFGTSLIDEMLSHSHNADVNLDYAPDGLRCEIAIPL